MNIIRKIIELLKNIIHKKNNVKMLDSAKELKHEGNKKDFKDSLKVNSIQKTKKKKVETLVCPGDGLGIYNKISY